MPEATPLPDHIRIENDRFQRTEPASAAELRTRSLFATGITVAALVMAAVVVVLAFTRSGDPVAGRAALDTPTVHGQARLYRDHITIQVGDLPPAPAGHHYQVWLKPRDSASLRLVGRLEPKRGAASLEAPLPGRGPFAAYRVSLDRDVPPATRPGVSIVQGTFT